MNFFLNDKYKVLKFLYDQRIELCNEYIVIITQDKIAGKLHFGKGKVNKIINELLRVDYLDNNYKVKGNYKLTSKAILIVEIIGESGEDYNDRI